MSKTCLTKKCACVATSAFMLLAMPLTFSSNKATDIAWADPTSDELRAQADEVRDDIASMQYVLDEASDDYNRALMEKESAEKVENTLQEEIDAAEQTIDKLQSQMCERAREMYKGEHPTDILAMFLNAKSFEEVVSTWDYLITMSRNDAKMLNDTQVLNEEIEIKKSHVGEQKEIAAEKSAEAEAIKEETEAKIAEYEEKLEELDEAAKEKAREEMLEAAAERASSVSYSEWTYYGSDIPANGSVVDYAMSRLGCPYVWAASGPNAFDCSGLVMWCYAQTGVSLPHQSESLYSCARAVLPVSQAEPGDVLYMPGHVGICTSYGGGTYIHAPTSGDVVRVATWPMFTCALRF